MALKRSGLIEFMLLMGKLKSTPRTGWVRCGVKKPESIADHMYRMGAIAFMAKSQSGLAQDRCIKMCLVHDMAESIVGDITPDDEVPDAKKYSLEQSAMERIKSLVGDEVGQEFCDLWEEYESQQTPESQFVKDLDKFDMIFQAFEYETLEKRPQEDLEQFFASCRGKFQTDLVKGWVDELTSLRAASASSTSSAKQPQQESGDNVSDGNQS